MQPRKDSDLSRPALTANPIHRTNAGLDGHNEAAMTIMLRPIASPMTLGLLGLAGGSFVLSGLQLGWIAATEGHNVALILLAFVFPLQFLASVFGVLGRDGIAATSMSVLACTWLSISLVQMGLRPGLTSDALGLLLVAACVAMLVPAAAALTSKLVLAAVFATAALRFLTSGAYQLSGSSTWKTAAGVVGLALSALAVYAATATALEDAMRRPVLPAGRRGFGLQALTGSLPEQVTAIHHEPGVRQQL
jgi:succinate-acetate transporter protein